MERQLHQVLDEIQQDLLRMGAEVQDRAGDSLPALNMPASWSSGGESA